MCRKEQNMNIITRIIRFFTTKKITLFKTTIFGRTINISKRYTREEYKKFRKQWHLDDYK